MIEDEHDLLNFISSESPRVTIYQEPDPSKKFIAKKVDKQSNGLWFLKFLNTSQPKSKHSTSCSGHNRRCGPFSHPISDHPDERDGAYADDDDRSSSLSIPNESIDFDLVYSLQLHRNCRTVEGQASLVLMDDSNSYWWLVRVLKTHEIGYIPA